jgi:hypothetical protein
MTAIYNNVVGIIAARDPASTRAAHCTEYELVMLGQWSSVSGLQHSRSRIWKCSSKSSASTWSFACLSARHVERENEEWTDDEDLSSFGSLSGWDITRTDTISDMEDAPGCFYIPGGEVFSSSTQTNKQVTFVSDADFDALPDWSDAEEDPGYNEAFVPDSSVWSITCRSLLDAA